MVRPELKRATQLQRKSTVSQNQRTADRDTAADWIETNVVDGDRNWSDWTIVEMAEQCQWSRQHLSSVLDGYFDPEGTELVWDKLAEASIDVDGPESYERGFKDGFAEGLRWGLENEEMLTELLETD